MYAYISRGFIVKGGWHWFLPRLLETEKELIVQKCHVKQACHLSNTVSLHKKLQLVHLRESKSTTGQSLSIYHVRTYHVSSQIGEEALA